MIYNETKKKKKKKKRNRSRKGLFFPSVFFPPNRLIGLSELFRVLV